MQIALIQIKTSKRGRCVLLKTVKKTIDLGFKPNDFAKEIIEAQIEKIQIYSDVFARIDSWEFNGSQLVLKYSEFDFTEVSDRQKLRLMLLALSHGYHGSSQTILVNKRLTVFQGVFHMFFKVSREKDVKACLKLADENQTEMIKKNMFRDAAIQFSVLTNPSLFDFLTELEFFSTVRNVFKYHLQGKDIKIDLKYQDPDNIPLGYREFLGMWENEVRNSYSTATVVFSDEIPYPAETDRWGDFKDIQKIDLQNNTFRVEGFIRAKQGFGYFMDQGTASLMHRKRELVQTTRGSSIATKEFINRERTPYTQNTVTREAFIERIINNHGLFCVQGPPGTGKTYLATEIIEEYFSKNPKGRILVSSKEHFALDNLMESCQNRVPKIKPLRLMSHRKEKKMPKENREFLRTQVSYQVRKIRTSKSDFFENIGDNLSDTRVEHMMLRLSQLIFTTTTDASIQELMKKTNFDLVIVEETGKCYPSELMHMLLMGNRVVLIGDQHQLPPFQIEQTEQMALHLQRILENGGTDRFNPLLKRLKTLDLKDFTEPLRWLYPFRELFDLTKTSNRYRLNHQYRMPKSLSNIIGNVFYDEIFEHKKLEKKNLSEYNKLFKNELIWIEMPHSSLEPEWGEVQKQGGGRGNPREIEVIARLLSQIKGKPDLYILTPYNMQKDALLENDIIRKLMKEKYGETWIDRIRTVDEFQGRESDIIIISLVRNNVLNEQSGWGFISREQRLNVMFSRVKEVLVIVGSSKQITRYKGSKEIEHLNRFFDEFKRYGRIISQEEII